MKTSEIRQAFLSYFQDKQHEIVKSSPLVPGNDPTLLFTNAGMVQFKECFLGSEVRSYNRATSSQRCVRAGGKHNDLDNVGYTARHHTFFEMLGNFSFGDYFKEDAMRFAWEFLTKTLGLPEDKLWVTVYKDDKEAEDIWFNKIGINQDRFSRLGEKDNFWSMGDTGPCGPCSEIFFDHGSDVDGGPPGSPDEDGDRYIEIWNLVFMQFNRHANGDMEPLPKPSVDTGMGLERIAAVLQNVHSNYEIDLFDKLITDIATIAQVKDKSNRSLRVIADHIRSCAFMVIDGVLPSNEGRGYVLRRIMRRAIRHGYKLGINELFFFKIVQSLVDVMSDAYPELTEQQAYIEKVLRLEEEQFAKTLDAGMKVLEGEISLLDSDVIPGDIVFKLSDTYGFPADLTADIAREKDLTIDIPGFEAALKKQRDMSKGASKFGVDYNDAVSLDGETTFCGYEALEGAGHVTHLMSNGQNVSQLEAGQAGVVVLDNTPFYAESGGQAGDAGYLISDTANFIVQDTKKLGDCFAHYGVMESGSITVGKTMSGRVEADRRQQTALNHSATHLLHAALRNILGSHVTQKGSLVDHEKLRFDFSHLEAVSDDEIKKIEAQVNQKIRDNLSVETEIMSPEQAENKGAMALFGEKYGEEVRVLTMGDYSMELCGGTHVAYTGEIGLFKLTSESGIAAGIRRIEGVTGNAALQYVQNGDSVLSNLCSRFKTERGGILEKLDAAQIKQKQLEKELDALKSKLASSAGNSMLDQAIEINGIKLLAAKLEGADPKGLRDTVDQLKNKLGSSIVVLATANDGKVSLIAGVSKDCIGKVKAGELVNFVAQQVGGKGGGRPDMAQAGGSQPENIDQAIQSVQGWVTERV
jgi:alanyl-tRNA synthetase